MTHAFAPIADPYAEMNKTERRYAERLDEAKLAGDIADWWFEPMTLKLANDTRYKPDFMVQRRDGEIELHEVKGYWRDASFAKTRIAQRMFPFTIRVVKWINKAKGWDIQSINEARGRNRNTSME